MTDDTLKTRSEAIRYIAFDLNLSTELIIVCIRDNSKHANFKRLLRQARHLKLAMKIKNGKLKIEDGSQRL